MHASGQLSRSASQRREGRASEKADRTRTITDMLGLVQSLLSVMLQTECPENSLGVRCFNKLDCSVQTFGQSNHELYLRSTKATHSQPFISLADQNKCVQSLMLFQYRCFGQCLLQMREHVWRAASRWVICTCAHRAGFNNLSAQVAA